MCIIKELKPWAATATDTHSNIGKKIMRLRQFVVAVTACLVTISAAWAETTEERRVIDATDVLDQLLMIPEQGIPSRLLSRAHAIAVIPSVWRVGFVAGIRRGKGILVVRQADNTWSNPAFITLTGGSFGFQAGAQTSDIILVFKNRASVDRIASGKLTLGADASVAAGAGRPERGSVDGYHFPLRGLFLFQEPGNLRGRCPARCGHDHGPQGECCLLR